MHDGGGIIEVVEHDQPEVAGEEGQSSPAGEDNAQSDVLVPPLEIVGAQAVSQGSSEAAALKATTTGVGLHHDLGNTISSMDGVSAVLQDPTPPH